MRKEIVFVLCVMHVSMLLAQVQTPTLRVGVLLPLQTEQTKRDRSMNRFADFYTGALMAVYEVQEAGQPIEVYTYDVGKSTNQLEQVLAQMPQLDMIIGPAYSSQVKVMAEWTRQHGVKTLLPFSSQVPEVEQNPYLMQFNPSERSDAEALVAYVQKDNPSARFVFVEAEEQNIPSSVKEIGQCVRGEGMAYSYTSITQIMNDSLGYVLSDSVENILVMNTERFGSLRQVMPYLTRAAQGKQLTLVTRYAWQDEPIILPQLYPTVFRERVDVDSTGYGVLYRKMVERERIQNRPCYDLLGYDLMHYTLETIAALKRAEDEWEEQEVIERDYKGLQSDIHFELVSETGGYQNKNIQIVRVR